MSEENLRAGWSANLPDTWAWASFSEVAIDKTDSARKLAKKLYQPDGRFPVIDQGEEFASGFSDDEDLVSKASLPCIVWGDHTRRSKFVETPFVQGADGVKVLVPSDAVLPELLFQQIAFAEVPDKGYSRHYKFLKAKKFPLPPLPEQKRIVRKLDTLSARTAAARAHLTGIAKLVKKYKHGVLGLIFENLERPTDELRGLTSLVTSGSRGWAKYYSDDGPLFIRVGDTRRGSPVLDLSDVQHVRPPDDGEGKRTKLVAGDLVVSITADLGRVGLIPEGVEEAYVNQHIALVRPHEVESSKFIAWYLISPPGQVQLFENDRGATKAGLGLDDIRDVRIPRFKPAEQREIVQQIETAFAKIDRLVAEAESAIELTDRLDQRILAKAFAGELVQQDPNDEPASALLERIRKAHANQPKPIRQTRKPRTMNKKSSLARVLDDWPSAGMTFEELRRQTSGTYDQVKEELFSLMKGECPKIRQEFDADEKTMRLKKVGT